MSGIKVGHYRDLTVWHHVCAVGPVPCTKLSEILRRHLYAGLESFAHVLSHTKEVLSNIHSSKMVQALSIVLCCDGRPHKQRHQGFQNATAVGKETMMLCCR